MNWDQLLENWKTARGHPKEEEAPLTEEEVERIDGKRAGVEEDLQERNGTEKVRAREVVDGWTSA
jgi:uncharacterized protein YjbJ (UPF0337 family)